MQCVCVRCSRYGGHPVCAALGYVQKTQPRLVICDNLDAAMWAGILAVIRLILEMSGYRVGMSILDTKHHGIPHSRHRLCIVAVRLDAEVEQFTFPDRMSDAPALEHFLRQSPHRKFMRFVPGGLAKRCTYIGRPSINGCNFSTKWFVLDPLAHQQSKRMLLRGMVPFHCRNSFVDICPTVYEIGALQGLPAKAVAAMLRSLDNDCATLGRVIGDASSVNVLMRILPRALFSAGLVAKPLPDHWALALTMSTGRGSAWKLPEALYAAVA